jgi:hypothetical protein
MAAMNRRVRATAALFAIVAMLFAPVAMALHSCPGAGDMAAAADAMASMAPDDGAAMDMSLCVHHCNDGKTSFDLAKPPAPIAAPIVSALRIAPLEPVSPCGPTTFDSPFAAPAGPAPPLTRFTVLLI